MTWHFWPPCQNFMGAFCHITPVLNDILDLCRFDLTYLTPPHQNFTGAFHHITSVLNDILDLCRFDLMHLTPLPKFHRCNLLHYTCVKWYFRSMQIWLDIFDPPAKISRVHFVTLHSIILLISSRKGCDTMLISILVFQYSRKKCFTLSWMVSTPNKQNVYGLFIDVSLTTKIIQNFVHIWIIVAALIEPLHVAIFTTHQWTFGKVMFSQVCVILSTGRWWVGMPGTRSLWGMGLGIQEGGVQGVGILGVYHGMGVEIGYTKAAGKTEGVGGYDLVYPLPSLVLTSSDGQWSRGYASYWNAFFFFCRILRRQHYISRTNGYLEFYRKTRNIRRAPLMVYSGGLSPRLVSIDIKLNGIPAHGLFSLTFPVPRSI